MKVKKILMLLFVAVIVVSGVLFLADFNHVNENKQTKNANKTDKKSSDENEITAETQKREEVYVIGEVSEIKKDYVVLNIEKYKDLFEEKSFDKSVIKFFFKDDTKFVKEIIPKEVKELEKNAVEYDDEKVKNTPLPSEKIIDSKEIGIGKTVGIILNSESKVDKVILKRHNPFLNLDLTEGE